MKFCNHCGTKLKENAKFCTGCGKNLEQSKQNESTVLPSEPKTTNEDAQHVEMPTQDQQGPETTSAGETPNQENVETPNEEHEPSEPVVHPTPKAEPPTQQQSDQASRSTTKVKKAFPLKLLLAIVLPIIVVIGGGVGGFFFAKDKADPAHLIERFESAIKAENADELSKLLATSSGSIELDGEARKEIFTYLQNNPGKLEETINALHEQVKGNIDDDSHWLSLKKEGKQLLFFDNYVLEVQPVHLLLSANFSGTELYVDGELVDSYKNEPIKTEALAPGEHTIRAVYSGEYGAYEKEMAINTFEHGTNEVPTSVQFDGKYVQIHTNQPDSTIYLNGERLGLASEITEYGPATTDGSMNLQAKYSYPWGEVASESVSVTEANVGGVNLAINSINDDLADAMMSTINEHVREYIKAYETFDPNQFTYMINEEYLEKMKNNFKSLQSDGFGFYGEAVSAEYDLGSITLTESDQYVATILVELSFNSAFYKKGEDIDKYPKEETSYIWNYELTYDEAEAQWFITNNEQVDEFETDAREVYDFNIEAIAVNESVPTKKTATVQSNGPDLVVNNTSELEQILKTAMDHGRLGPFDVNALRDYDSVLDGFGDPERMYNASCTECDDFDVAYYGDYGVDIFTSDNIDIWLDTGLVRSELEKILGEPARADIGMYEYQIYEGGKYPLAVEYQNWDTGYGRVYVRN